MSSLSQLAESMTGSEIVRLGNEISRRVQQGEKIYNYTIGDFDPEIFPVPALLEELIIESYKQKNTNYPPADGVLELRDVVSKFIERNDAVHYAPNEIQIASGGRPLIYAAFKTIVDRDDKVIYAAPSWNNNHYTGMNRGAHCLIAAFPENNFMPSAADIAPHIAGAALLCLCSPQNPTGTVMQQDTMENICDLVLEENSKRAGKDKKLYLLFDQMYSLLTYGDVKHFHPVALRPAMKEFTISIDGISKSFAATGVRVGWAAGPANVIAKIRALLGHTGGWAPMAEQKATARFLQQPQAIEQFLGHFKNGLYERLLTIYQGLMRMKDKGLPVDCIAPQAGIYLTIKLPLAGMTADGALLKTQKDVTEYLLDKARLAIVPFYAFGADDSSPWYRLSVGTCVLSEIPEMLVLLENALRELS